MQKDEILDELIEDIKDDYFGLWVIPWKIITFTNTKLDEQVKDRSLKIVKQLINRNILPGWLAPAGKFDFWRGTPDELYQRVTESWSSEGIPTLGSNHCWFAQSESKL